MLRFAPMTSVLLVLTAPLSAQTVWYVDQNDTNCRLPGSSFCRIQDAINAAASGDIILVRPSPSPYLENLNFLGKAIWVRSDQDFNPGTVDIAKRTTIIDGSRGSCPSPVVTFQSGEGRASVLEGFTITGGTGWFHDPSNFHGGGIHCLNTSPTIRRNIIKDNQADNGGGIGCRGDASPLIEQNLIGLNTAEDYGGGVNCGSGSASLDRNYIVGNHSDFRGGGVRIADNATPKLRNNFITKNTADDGGGAISCHASSTAVMVNNTLTQNAAATGGALYLTASASVEVFNSILWNNTPSEITIDSGTVIATFSDIQGGWAGAGNMNANPRFVNPAGCDFHLSWISPCINSGTNGAPCMPSSDYDGHARALFGTVDMGADEFSFFHVPPSLQVR